MPDSYPHNSATPQFGREVPDYWKPAEWIRPRLLLWMLLLPLPVVEDEEDYQWWYSCGCSFQRYRYSHYHCNNHCHDYCNNCRERYYRYERNSRRGMCSKGGGDSGGMGAASAAAVAQHCGHLFSILERCFFASL